MRSNLLSRLLPTNPSARSIYDDLRAHDEASGSDIEERAGLALDEENLGFHDDELANADVFNGEDSRITTASTPFLPRQHNHPHRTGAERKATSKKGHSKWLAESPRLLEEDGDDDVPPSLLIEGNGKPGPSDPSDRRVRHTGNHKRQSAIPGPSTRETRNHWEAAQVQQRLHQEDTDGTLGEPQATRLKPELLTGSPREKAMWRWINITNLDNFITEVYDYYTGAGIWCIVLDRALSLV